MGESMLGRKPSWLARWEDRSQARFDRKLAEERVTFRASEAVARRAALRDVTAKGGAGQVLSIRAVPEGESLRRSDADVLGGGVELAAQLGWWGMAVAFVVVVGGVVVAALTGRPSRPQTRWTVGVLHRGAFREAVLHEEQVADEDTAIARVRELAARVEAGEFDAKPDR